MKLDDAKELAQKLRVYVHEAINPGVLLYGDDKIGLYFTEGISHSFHLYVSKDLHPNPYFFVQLPWHHDRDLLQRCIAFYKAATDNKFGVERLVLCANSEIELEAARAEGLKYSELINQNAWLDFNIFEPDYDVEKNYDLVLNCRPEAWKRPELAAQVDNLAIIKGANHRPSAYMDLSVLNPKYMNEERIPPTEVVKVLNQSRLGGIFSAIEGACYSSSEYLLMGLPVISTPSLGGRDYWFNEENAIICDPTAEAVAQAVREGLENLKTGKFSPKNIRDGHVAESNMQRRKFIALIGQLLSERGSSGNAEEIFSSKYTNKMVRYSKVS